MAIYIIMKNEQNEEHNSNLSGHVTILIKFASSYDYNFRKGQ